MGLEDGGESHTLTDAPKSDTTCPLQMRCTDLASICLTLDILCCCIQRLPAYVMKLSLRRARDDTKLLLAVSCGLGSRVQGAA